MYAILPALPPPFVMLNIASITSMILLMLLAVRIDVCACRIILRVYTDPASTAAYSPPLVMLNIGGITPIILLVLLAA